MPQSILLSDSLLDPLAMTTASDALPTGHSLPPGVSGQPDPSSASPGALTSSSSDPHPSVVSLLRDMMEDSRHWREQVERERLLLSKEREETSRERLSERRWGMFFKALFFGAPFLLGFLWFLFAVATSGGFSFGPFGETVGVVRVSGEIKSGSWASADRVVPALHSAFSNSSVKAVIIEIDSPGGSPVEAERIYNAIRDLKKRFDKPVVSVVESTGASAAYMIAMHTDHIYASTYSLVGSIGAVMTGWDVHKAMDKLNIGQRVYSSGHLKAMLNPFAPATPQANRKAQSLVSTLGDRFLADVVAARGSKLKEGVNFGTGEVWTGLDAVSIGLADEIGTLEQVISARWPGLSARSFGPRDSGFKIAGRSLLPSLDPASLMERASEHAWPTVR